MGIKTSTPTAPAYSGTRSNMPQASAPTNNGAPPPAYAPEPARPNMYTGMAPMSRGGQPGVVPPAYGMRAPGQPDYAQRQEWTNNFMGGGRRNG